MTAAALKGQTITISIPLTVEVDALAAAITSGMITGPHGYAYWCDEVKIGRYAPGFEGFVNHEASVDAIARNVLAGGTARFREYDESTGKTIKWHELTKAKLVRGFGRWVVGASRGGNEIESTGLVDFDIDAPASDLIMQYALLNEQRYG